MRTKEDIQWYNYCYIQTPKNKQYKKQYYLEHKEEKKTYNKQYYQNNKDNWRKYYEKINKNA